MATLQPHSQSETIPATLTEAILAERVPSFANLAPLASNVEALEAGLLFSRGHQPFVIICGPSGLGKTEILSAAQHHFRLAKLMSADHFLSGKGAPVGRDPVLLDDCQSILGKPRRMVTFRSALDRRIRSGAPTLLSFTSEGCDAKIRRIIPRFSRWARYQIESPTVAERAQLVNHVAKLEQLSLSPVLIRIMSRWLDLTGRQVVGLLARLKLEGSCWTDSSSVLRACGILDPYFADQTSWDLGLRIAKVGRLTGVSEEMLCHVSLRVAGLCEDSVARLLEIPPGKCYAKAVCFEGQKRLDPNCANAEHRFVEAILQSLVN